MRAFAWFAGLAAILCRVKFGGVLPFDTKADTRELTTLCFAALFAAGFVFFSRLDKRTQSQTWILAAFGLIGCVLLIAGPLSGLFSFRVSLWTMRLKLSLLYPLLELALLPLLIKLVLDLRTTIEVRT